jgi:hypothetical protein
LFSRHSRDSNQEVRPLSRQQQQQQQQHEGTGTLKKSIASVNRVKIVLSFLTKFNYNKAGVPPNKQNKILRTTIHV